MSVEPGHQEHHDSYFGANGRFIQIRGGGEAGGSHLAGFDKPAAADQIVLTPVTAFSAGRKTLDGLAFIDALQRAVNPAEAQGHLHGIGVTDDTGTGGFGPIDAQPEFGHPLVVLQVPVVQLFPGINLQQ